MQVVNNTSIITVESVRRLDAGKVVCKAKNGVGTSVTTKTTMLIINREDLFVYSRDSNPEPSAFH